MFDHYRNYGGENNLVLLWQGEPDLNWQLRCRRPPCSQLHHPLLHILWQYILLSVLLKCSSSSPPECSACISNHHKFRFTSTWSASNSKSVRIFTSWGYIVNPLSWSHKSLILIPFRVRIWSFHSISRTNFPLTYGFFLFCLLLLSLQNSHFICPRHRNQTVQKLKTSSVIGKWLLDSMGLASDLEQPPITSTLTKIVSIG